MENNFSSGWYTLGYLQAKYEHRLDEMARALNWPVTPDLTFAVIGNIVDDWFKRIATETQKVPHDRA